WPRRSFRRSSGGASRSSALALSRRACSDASFARSRHATVSAPRSGADEGGRSMRYPREELDAYRKSAGEFENELIDEYREGTVTRRELLQRGSVLGMSLSLMSLVAGVPLA